MYIGICLTNKVLGVPSNTGYDNNLPVAGSLMPKGCKGKDGVIS